MRRELDNDIFRHICEAAPDGIVVVDAHGRIVMCNGQFERLFGFPRGDVEGQSIEMLLPGAAREAHVGLREGYTRHPTTRPMDTGRQLLAQRKDGSEFPVEISLSPFESSGVVQIIAVVRDISDRRRLEEEREQLRAIAETERERQRIAMDLHDGIIQSIYGAALNLEMAAEDVKPAPDEAIAQINTSIDQLNDTIRDLRSYILDLRPARYGGDLAGSLRNLVTEFRANSLIEASLELDPHLASLTEDQEAAVFHIVQEALNNARKHSRATQVTLSVRQAGGTVRLEIADNGSGFDPGRPLAEESRGMRNMLSRATSVGGMLRVETAPGAGTSVYVELAGRETGANT